MAPLPTSSVLAKSVVECIRDGGYPESEIVTSELTTAALDDLLQRIEFARSELQATIQGLSKEHALDIDTWISQAQELQAAIETTDEDANRIEQLVESVKDEQANLADTTAKVALLEDELAFNDELTTLLEELQAERQRTSALSEGLTHKNFKDVLLRSVEVDGHARYSSILSTTNPARLLRSHTEHLQRETGQVALQIWNENVNFNELSTTFRMQDSQTNTGEYDLNVLAHALKDAALWDPLALDLQKSFLNIVSKTFGGPASQNLTFEPSSIRVDEAATRQTPSNASFDAFLGSIKWSCEHFRGDILRRAFEELFPVIVQRFIENVLASAIPEDLNQITTLHNLLEEADHLSKAISEHNLPGFDLIDGWKEEAPRMWLNKRLNVSLNSVRRVVARGVRNPRAVERVETQVIAANDELFSPGLPPNGQSVSAKTIPDVPQASNVEEDDSADAWGWDNDESTTNEAEPEEQQGHVQEPKAGDDAEDVDDAWGWQDEDDAPAETVPPSSIDPAPANVSNGIHTEQREVTLRETYYISAFPEQLLEIIIQEIEEIDQLVQNPQLLQTIPDVADRLCALPELMLSLFRAIAPIYYSKNACGNMYLLNDSAYIAEQLEAFGKHRKSRQREGQQDIFLDVAVGDLQSFGRRCYSQELELQRSILRDLLDGAQGFANSTQEPFAEQCDIAITSVADRIREVHSQWAEVLSNSALSQAVGSLLSTVVEKVIIDFEDMSDISEPESKRLRGFCTTLSELEDLFIPVPAEGVELQEQPMPLTVLYTSKWIKFQYLAEILDSSLADIKYMWEQGGLSEEFEPSEIIDLMEALFADSDYRRKAINEIKRAAR